MIKFHVKLSCHTDNDRANGLTDISVNADVLILVPFHTIGHPQRLCQMAVYVQNTVF